MSDGYPTAAQKEALRLVCGHDGLDTERLAEHLIGARRSSPNPGYAQAITRMAGTLAWRLEAQGFIVQKGDTWTATPTGRGLIACRSGTA